MQSWNVCFLFWYSGHSSDEGRHEGLNPQQHGTKIGGQGARGGDCVPLLQRHQGDAELDVVVV